MNCQNCGVELPEDVHFCTNCGTPMSGVGKQEEETVQELSVEESSETAEIQKDPTFAAATAEAPADDGKQKKSPTKKLWILLASIGGALVVLAVAIWLCLPLIRYGVASVMLNSGNYQKAWAAFEALEDFRDSPEKLRQSQYGQAGIWLEEGQIQEARQIYIMLGEDYAGCAQQIKECDYRQALIWLEAGKLQEALDGFTALGDYKDSPDRIAETNYRRALLFMEQAELEKAMQLLKELGDYKDSAAQLTECNYRYVLALMEAGSYTEAQPILETLGDYKDSESHLTECRYQTAVKLLSEGKFTDAKAILETLGDYKDTAEQLKECKYQKALKDLDDGQIVAGYDALIALDDYKDSAQKAKDVKATYDRIKAKPKLFRSGDWKLAGELRIYMTTKVVDSNTIKIEISVYGGPGTGLSRGADYKFTGKWDAKTGKLNYTKGTCYEYKELENENGELYEKEGYAYKNGKGYFYYKNDLIHWVDNTKGERRSFKYSG